MKKIKKFLSNDFLSERLNLIPEWIYIASIIAVGIIIRGRQYLANRSFWLDEAFLAINFKTRSFLELLEPLDYSQVAPIGFLWLEKAMASLFGLSELSLRFLPFIISIIAIYLLYDLSRILLSKRLALIIAFIFILPITLTYFSSELKQYMSDLIAALFLFWYYFRFVDKRNSVIMLIVLGFLGGLIIWLSNITPLILSSIGLAIFINLCKNFSWSSLISSLVAYGLWVVSFIIYYTNFIQDHPHTVGMKNYWASYFMPLGVSQSFHWIYNTMEDFFRNTAGYYEMTYYFMALFTIGIVSVFFTKKYNLFYLLLPLLIHMILSMAKIYPFGSRLILYQIPVVLIFEVIGLSIIARLVKFRIALMIVLSVVLLKPSILRAGYYVVHPMMVEDIKPVLFYVADNKKTGDVIYAYSGSHAAFKFYRENYFTEDEICIVGISSADQYDNFVNEFEEIKGRVWIIFSHMSPSVGIKYLEEQIPAYQQLDFFEADGAKVYLIDK